MVDGTSAILGSVPGDGRCFFERGSSTLDSIVESAESSVRAELDPSLWRLETIGLLFGTRGDGSGESKNLRSLLLERRRMTIRLDASFVTDGGISTCKLAPIPVLTSFGLRWMDSP